MVFGIAPLKIPAWFRSGAALARPSFTKSLFDRRSYADRRLKDQLAAGRPLRI